MKKLIIIFLFTPFISKSQECPRYDKTISLSGGVPTNIYIEAGLQGDLFGVSIGAKATFKNMAATKTTPLTEMVNVNPYLKGSIKIFGGEDDFYRLYGIGYAGFSVWGVGTKLGWITNDDLMIYLQPEYTEQKTEIDLGVSFRF